VVDAPLGTVDVMPTLLALAGGKGADDHPFDGKNIWPGLAEGKPSPHDELLINVEAIRGAIRKGYWKLVRLATLPGKTELFNLADDPGDIVDQLNARLLDYAREMKPSEWIKAQPAFLGAQGGSVFDPDFDIDDDGLPHEKAELPAKAEP
jgi:arylsulfatase A-like enzyme